MVTFSKLKDGSWGLRGERGDVLTPGAQVDVVKRDGTRRRITIGRVVATYSDTGCTYATIGADGEAPAKAPAKAPKGDTATAAARRMGRRSRYECTECGEHVYPASGYCPVSGVGH